MLKNPAPGKKKDEDFELIQAINAGQKKSFYDLVKRYDLPGY